MTDYRAISDAALRSSDAVIRHWLPGGERKGREYLARNPTRDDERPGSFSVNLVTGAWADFATGDRGGDMVSLIVYITGTRQGPAADTLARFLGLKVNGTGHSATDRTRRGIGLEDSLQDSPLGAQSEAWANIRGSKAEGLRKPTKATWRARMPIPEDAPPPPARHRKLGEPSATWTYRDAEGRPLCHVRRFEQPAGGKEFRPLTFCEDAIGKRAWRWQGPPEPRTLYGLDRLAAHPAATVIVCEGERAADAVAQLLPPPEYVATTSLNGSQSPNKADWSPLAERTIIVWPDADEPGTLYADTVCELARKAGAASISILDPGTLRDDPPKGWDAADALAEGFTPDHLRLILAKPDVYLLRADHVTHSEAGDATTDQAAEVRSPKDGDSLYRVILFKKGYRNGVYFVGDGEPLLICSPLVIAARTRDPRNGNWGYLLEWDDPDGRPHSWAMPAELLSGDGTQYRSVLLDGGLHIAPGSNARQHLTSYIQGTHTETRARCTDRTGWHGPAFVLPDRVIGPQEGERVIFQSAAGAANYFATSGSLDDWRREVGALAQGNTRLRFAISSAFASVLLELTGDENGGFHQQGPSSEGKSSALYAAASVFGARNYLHRWRATSNGLEAIATAHSGALLILDELGQVDPKEAGEIAYMLANGSGKHRADRTGGARRNQTWRLLFLSSGEIDLAQHMLSIGKRARAGQEARLLSFAANPGAGLGIYEDLRGFPDGAALSRALDEATRRYYGSAGVAFIEAVARDLARLPDIIRESAKTFVDTYLPANASGQVYRAVARFALVAVGGELAIRYGVTDWTPGSASQAAGACFQSWLDGRGGAGDREATAILAQVRRFFENHGEARFHNWDLPDERPIINRAGVRRLEGETWTYCVLPETFREEVCAGFDQRTAVKVLDEAGLLTRNPSDGRPTCQDRLPGIGKTRYYLIRPFGADIPENAGTVGTAGTAGTPA